MFATEQYLYVIQVTQSEKILISRCSLDDIANIQNYKVGEQFGSLIVGCYFSKNQILLSARYLEDYFYKQFVLFNLDTNSLRPVGNVVKAIGEVRCSRRDRCILIEEEEDDHRSHHQVKIIRLDKETWKNQTVNLRMRDQHRKLTYTKGGIEITDYGSLLFVDSENFRITEYTSTGEFLRHWITEKDCPGKPRQVSYNHPYLWVIYLYSTEDYRMELIRYSLD